MISRAAHLLGVVATVFVLSGWPCFAYADPDDSANISIEIAKKGDVVVVDASFTAPVTRRQAWDVLTDYVHMPDFLFEIRTSKVLKQNGNALRVFQDGRVFFGPFPIFFEYLRDIELEPYRQIRSHSIGGSLKRGDMTTTLAGQGTETRITYHSEAVPGIWIPLGIGRTFIRNRLRERFVAMRGEMIRRDKADKDR